MRKIESIMSFGRIGLIEIARLVFTNRRLMIDVNRYVFVDFNVNKYINECKLIVNYVNFNCMRCCTNHSLLFYSQLISCTFFDKRVRFVSRTVSN